jgi:hypothetical protein
VGGGSWEGATPRYGRISGSRVAAIGVTLEELSAKPG